MKQTLSDEAVLNYLHNSFGWGQIEDDINREKWDRVATATLEVYLRTDMTTRRKWAKSFVSLPSSRKLDHIAYELAIEINNSHTTEDPVALIDIILSDGRLKDLFELNEIRNPNVRTRRNGGENINISIKDILIDWVSGKSLIYLSKTYFSSISDIEYRFESLGDFINYYFEVTFPWVFGTLISWTNGFLGELASTVELPRSLSSYIRWGVDNPISLELLATGILSRNLATRIANTWEMEGEFVGLREWIRSMEFNEWKDKFNPSTAELRNLLDYARTKKGGITVDLIEGEIVELKVKSNITNAETRIVDLNPTSSEPLSPIGIWFDNELIGEILARDYVDIQTLLSMGLPYLAQFYTTNNEGVLNLEMIDPDS